MRRTITAGREADPTLVLGRYRPLRPLGSGGSGSVWLARDEATALDVALKVVRREGKAASRAEREVAAATRLRHPHCLRALALERDDEHVYVAYEYVRGRTLREALRSGELTDAAAVEAAAQVAEALAHAHAKGVVHRDVKPANVMVEDGDETRVRVLDFGLASVDEADTLTAAGDVPGTLAYVSPERLDGHSASGAADVWALGVVLWEALAGWHPFTAGSPVETARRIRTGPEPLARARPDLPRELCALVDRMLAVDPRRRPPARRVADALRAPLAERRRRPRAATSLASLRERALHASLAFAFATGSALALPFFPRGWPPALGLLAALLALRAPRAGLAFALAVPVLPLGNVALGLALVWTGVAALWLALFARDARSGLLPATGPALAAVGLVGLVPLVAQRAHGAAARAAVAAGAFVAATATAALGRLPLPFPLAPLPEGLGLEATRRPDATVGAMVEAVRVQPGIAIEAALLALAAATAPAARRRGGWGVAGWGSAFVAGALLAPRLAGIAVHAWTTVPGVCLATLALGAQALRRSR
ncbi:MAG: serine/threonine protein kinase [Thermoleophilia bacterium]|nr:serine/threonine protein kinase [Thermoleophilia bacterium]